MKREGLMTDSIQDLFTRSRCPGGSRSAGSELRVGRCYGSESAAMNALNGLEPGGNLRYRNEPVDDSAIH